MRTITNAQAISGWMEGGDLNWLAEHAKQAHQIVEIGCWMGRSTTVLAENSPEGAIVYAVDTWLGSEEHHPPVKGLYEAFESNMRSHIASGKVRPFRITSTEAARQFGILERRFDLVFIDAAHDYDSVKADITAWKPLVSSGGILCGHDAGHPPIMQALEELLPNRLPNEGSMWVIQL